MKLRIALVVLISMLMALGLVGIAGAQSVCSTIHLTTGTAQPGGTDTVCGSDAGNGGSVSVDFDSTEVASSTADEYGIYCIAFTVPTTATVGTHVLTVRVMRAQTNCPVDYVVEAAAIAPTTTPPKAPTTLPSTGFFLVPAGGLFAGGLGMLLFRKRRR